MVRRLGWVTATAARGLDEDEPLALAALAAAGARVDVVAWDDASVDWSAYDRVVLRSTWDYAERIVEFRGWLERVDAVTELLNPLPPVAWSLDKHYLAELLAAGVPTVPTTLLEPGDTPVLPEGPVVIKPAVGAGSRDAAWYAPEAGAAAAAHVAELHARDAAVVVQPRLASVAAEGEWPLLFFDGAYSHAASKRVALPEAGRVAGLAAEELLAAHEAYAEQRAVAETALALVVERFGTPSYARVDLVRGDYRHPLVLEVELVEPSLFLPQGGPAAVDRLVAALVARRSRQTVEG